MRNDERLIKKFSLEEVHDDMLEWVDRQGDKSRHMENYITIREQIKAKNIEAFRFFTRAIDD